MKKYSFEHFIMQCCKAREWKLRSQLRTILTSSGFKIIEDDYLSSRGDKYNKVHNMLAIRGNPKTCLVAHTDVCRDHGWGQTPEVNPVIKSVMVGNQKRNIIQDKFCQTQVGGDDRLGVAINTWIATNTGYDLGLLFTTDEEIGVVSAEYVNFKELLDFEILLQVDRGNYHDQLVTQIGGTVLCSEKTGDKLIDIAEKINLPRVKVRGFLTDVLALKDNDKCREAVNMTCGYMQSYGSGADEYIDIEKAKETLKYVANIIKFYELGEDEFNNSLSE